MSRAIWQCETVSTAPPRCCNRIAYRLLRESHLKQGASHVNPLAITHLQALLEQAETFIEDSTRWRPRLIGTQWYGGDVRWAWGDVSRQIVLHLDCTHDTPRESLSRDVAGLEISRLSLPLTPVELGLAWLWLMEQENDEVHRMTADGKDHCATCGRELRSMATGGGADALWDGAKFCGVTCALTWCRLAESRLQWSVCTRCARPTPTDWMHEALDLLHCDMCEWRALNPI